MDEPEPEQGGSRRVRFRSSNIEAEVEAFIGSSPVPGPVPVTPVSSLGNNELRLIFSSHRISTKDLLNVRLVNKSWCDVATSTLLERDACQIALDMNPLADDSDSGDADEARRRENYFFYKHGDQDKTLHKLSSLLLLMSTSPKFPASTFRIQTSQLFVSKYYKFPDLVLFCELYGNQIKTLCPVGLVSYRYLLDVFFTHLPNLECLDLSEATPVDTNELTESDLDSRTIPIQSLIIGYTAQLQDRHHNVLQSLLFSPSKLSCIKNVDTSTLSVVLEHGKGPLIKCFEYTLPESIDEFEPLLPLIDEFAALNPKLTKLTLIVHRITGQNSFLYEDTLPLLNAIIHSSKDTLQELVLCVDPAHLRTKLNIPPMKNLTSVTLSGTRRVHDTQGPDAPTEMIENEDSFVFGFEDINDGVSAAGAGEYFPSLVKIRLKSEGWCINKNILVLEKFLSNKDGSRRDRNCYGKVDTLEIHHSSWPNMSDGKLIAELLPNIRVLQIRCQNLRTLSHSLWVMCPKVEFIDIKGLLTKGLHISTDRSLFFDKFFSGFCLDMIHKLRATEVPENMDNPGTFSLLRLHPSVTDLQNLKQFNLKYSGTAQLVSRVAELYVFAKMPNTKFNLLYHPEDEFIDSIDPYEDQYEDVVIGFRQR